MLIHNVENVVKKSFVYSLAISQPVTIVFGATLFEQNNYLMDQPEQQLGDQGEVVRLIQLKLNNLGYYDELIDGKYGILTQFALKEFQSSHNIKVTGDSDKETMKQLIDQEKSKLIDDIKQLLINRDTTQMSKTDLMTVQKKLAYLGYYDGEIDGIYGILTENAIKTLYNDEKHKATSIKAQVKNNGDQIIDIAYSYIGTPYIWGGESPSGFDCSGFIQYVYKQDDKTIPRTVNEIWNFSDHVEKPSIGDLIFFETYKPGPSHLGIYLGDKKFIHASTKQGVTISSLNENYWQNKYLGAKRIY